MKTYSSTIAALALTLAAAPVSAGLFSGTRWAAPATGLIDPVSGMLSVSGSLRQTWVRLPGGFVPSNNALATTSSTVDVAGSTRRYVSMRPNAPAANLPVLLVLHPSDTTPEGMTFVTEIADFAATQGFWAVLPEARSGKWQDDPARDDDSDVRFVGALVDRLVAEGADASRIYVAGYSNGGFMATRLACEAADRIAAFGVVAATTRDGVANACATPTVRPLAFFLGTDDTTVRYNGALGMRSASATMAFWNGRAGCGGIVADTLPDAAPGDGTTVQRDRHTGCRNGVENQLYTVQGGGHTWPGGAAPLRFGRTTQDIDATGLIWNFVSGYRR